MAEVLHDAIVQVTQVPTRFDSIAFPGGDVQKTDFYPLGHAGRPALRLGRRELLPPGLRPQPAADRLRVRAVRRADDGAGAPPLQRHHAQREAESARQPAREAARACGSEGMSDAALVDEIYLACLARYPDRAPSAASCSRCCRRRAIATSARSSRMCSGAC